MQRLRRLAFALSAVALSTLVLGALQISASDGRAAAAVSSSTRSAARPAAHPSHRRRHHARKHQPGASSNQGRSIAQGSNRSADPSVTIADFSFTPATITVHVGDTVTWINNGPSAHTATADDGSFNTGVLQKGQSASVTFHRPGTFGYHCAIHPFMHGTVVVLGNPKTPSPEHTTPKTHSSGPGAPGKHSGGPSKSANPAVTTPAASAQNQLPFTGVDVEAIVALGLVLGASGLVLQWLRRRRLG